MTQTKSDGSTETSKQSRASAGSCRPLIIARERRVGRNRRHERG